MRKKDVFFLALLVGAVCLMVSPALFQPNKTLGNFGDIYAYHYPLQHSVAAEILSGRLPFWNPFIFSGQPLLANSQSAVFYPLAAIFRIFPLTYAFTLYAAAHLALAALGMYLFLRASRLDAGMAAAFAAAFCLGPFLVYRIPQGIPTHLAALAYVPWCWLALRSGRTGFLAGAWTLQFFSGHPSFVLINAVGMAGYAGVEFLKKRAAPAIVMAREGGIAAALALVQLFPMAELILRSNRSGIPDSFKTAYSMPPSAFGTLLLPSLFGDPLRGDFMSAPSLFFEICAVYVGWIPLAFAAYGLYCALRAQGDPLAAGPLDARTGWILASIGTFLALGGWNPLVGWMRHLPIVGLSRVPARFSFLAVWGLLLAGAAGWQRLRARRRIPPAWKAAVVLCVFADMGFWAAHFIYTENPAPYLRPNAVMRRVLAGKPLRFASSPQLANPNKSMLYRAMNVNGYDAFYLDSYTRYAARSERGPAGDPSRTHLRRTDSPEMRRLGVSYYLTPENRPGESIEVSAGAKLYKEPGAYPLAYFSSPAAGPPPRSFAQTSGHWRVEGSAPDEAAVLVLGVPYYPGWRAYLDGARVPISPHDGLVQAIALPASGTPFRADFLFIPTAWGLLCALSAAAWIGWSVGALRGIFA